MTLTATSVGDNQQAPGLVADTFNPDQLIAGPLQLVTDTVTVASGQVIQRGAVLGQIAANGKYVLALASANDGSQTPAAIAADNIDASAGDVLGGVYLSGEFNINAMTFGTGITPASAKVAFRSMAIFLKTMTPGLSSADPT